MRRGLVAGDRGRFSDHPSIHGTQSEISQIGFVADEPIENWRRVETPLVCTGDGNV